MNKVLLVLTAFSLGYVVQDIAKEYNLDPISEVRAEVAGAPVITGTEEDFVRAVRYIVQKHCTYYDPKIYCGIRYGLDGPVYER